MHLLRPELHSRRAFLKRSGQLALAGTALPMALNLAAIGEAAAFNATDNTGANDYKALVCVFLYGGNDFANTVVTYDDASYNLYNQIRQGGPGQTAGGIALAKADLAATLLNPLAPPADALGATTRQFALNPAMSGLSSLFNVGKVAVQLNVGPLTVPLTRDQYNSADHTSYPRPAQLFSHNDQQSTWQSSAPEGSKVGWGGSLGDLALSSNGTSTFTCMSVTGNAVYLSGNTAVQYQVTSSGAIPINAAVTGSAPYGSQAVSSALRSLVQQSRTHALESDYNKITVRSMAAQSVVAQALAGTSTTSGTPLTGFPAGSTLSDQLQMVARLIAGRSTLGARRQVFMVSLSSFDMHDYLIRDHGGMLSQVSGAMAAFYAAIANMGLANKVTAFTASDFGRTLATNGDGSDHGWGNHHFVMGGAVNGQRFYGVAPPVSTSDAKTGNAYNPENQWHVGQGRLLPSTSVDQFGATMAQWFGVAQSEMAQVFPHIGNFAGTFAGGYMGFMNPT